MPKVEAEKYYKMQVTVTGNGTFPVDMLRYDRCCPATEKDSHAIERSGERTITLERFSKIARMTPEVGRWKSFGWLVMKVVYFDGTEESREWPGGAETCGTVK